MDDIQSGSVDGADAAAAAAVSRSDDHERSRIANNDDSVLTTATSEDRSASLEDSDYQESSTNQLCSKRKRPRAEFPWLYTHDWSKGDPPRLRGKRQCVICKKWFSASSNAQGWKAHLKTQHSIISSKASATNNNTSKLVEEEGTTAQSSLGILQMQQTIKKPLLPHVARRFENAIVDFVIGGDISLRAAGEERFQQLVMSLTDGYVPPSTRTILRRTVELFSIAQPLLAQFFCNLDVRVSLTMDGWSNRNLKGFYVVTAHWIDTLSGQMKSLLLTILDVSSRTGVGNRVGSALFTYLRDMVGPAFLSQLLHVVTDNGSDACTAVSRLFHLMNSYLGSKVMLPSNHVRCADHSVQRGVISILSQVKAINEKLRGALVSIRRSKVLRQSYRLEAERLGYASKEPTHQDSPTRWNSTHEMCTDALKKREALDQTMVQHQDDLGMGPLTDLEWTKVGAVMNFLRVPRQVMESLAADRKSSLDLVELSIAHLIKHCETNEEQLKAIDGSISATDMKTKLELYQSKLVQLPAIVAGYLNPQIPKPSDRAKLQQLKERIRAVLKEQYADKMKAYEPAGRSSVSESDTSLFEALFAGSSSAPPGLQENADGVPLPVFDEVNRYLSMGVVHSQSFIDVIQWWKSQKEMLPAHYQMAMDYLGTPATSTPSERVNSMAGREFTTARQSLSSEIFIKTMCLRSWMKAQVITLPKDRQLVEQTRRPNVAAASPGGVSTSTAISIEETVTMIEIEQQDWVEEVLDDSMVGMLNIQFDNMVADEASDLSCL